MNPYRNALACAAVVLLAGCVAPTPSAEGHSVRAIMASQAVTPQPPAARGTDAASAMAAYNNYQKSYAQPVAQSERGTFSGK